MSAIDLEEVIAARERIDSSDAAIAIRLARTASASESEAWDLLAEAQQRAERLAGTLEFQRAVRAAARELLIRRELDAEAIRALLGLEGARQIVTEDRLEILVRRAPLG